MNLSAVAALPCRPIASVWYRAVKPQHLPRSLGYCHTRLIPSRYYEGPTAPVPFETLYLAENPIVAQFEVEALFGSLLHTMWGGAEPGQFLADRECSGATHKSGRPNQCCPIAPATFDYRTRTHRRLARIQTAPSNKRPSHAATRRIALRQRTVRRICNDLRQAAL